MAKLLQGLFGSFMDLQFFAPKGEGGDGGDGDFNADDIPDDDSDEVFGDNDEDDEGDSQDDPDDEDEDGEGSEEPTDDDDSDVEIDLDSLDEDDNLNPEQILKRYKNDPQKMAAAYAKLEKKLGEQGKTIGDLKKQLDGSEPGKDKGGQGDQGDKSTKKVEFKKPELGMTKDEFNEKFFDDPYENANKLIDTLAYEKLAPMVETINTLLEDIAPIVADHQNRSTAKDLQSKFDEARDELHEEFGNEFDALVPQMVKHLEARPDLVKTPEQLRPFFKKLRQAAISQGKMEALLKRSKQQKATGTTRMGGGTKPPSTSKGKPRGQETGDEYLDRVFGTKPKVFKP